MYETHDKHTVNITLSNKNGVLLAVAECPHPGASKHIQINYQQSTEFGDIGTISVLALFPGQFEKVEKKSQVATGCAYA